MATKVEAKKPAAMTAKIVAKKPAAKTQNKVAPAKAAKKTVTVKAKKRSAKKTTPSTEFKLFAPDANEVYVTGDFNDWNTSELKARKFKDGTWKKSVKLKPGQYEYLFLVDGEWWTDPKNVTSIINQFGTENSVIIVG